MNLNARGVDFNIQQAGLFSGRKSFFPQRPQSVNIFNLTQRPHASAPSGARKAGTTAILQGALHQLNADPVQYLRGHLPAQGCLPVHMDGSLTITPLTQSRCKLTGLINDFHPDRTVFTGNELLHPFAVDILRHVGFATIGHKQAALEFVMISFLTATLRLK